MDRYLNLGCLKWKHSDIQDHDDDDRLRRRAAQEKSLLLKNELKRIDEELTQKTRLLQEIQLEEQINRHTGIGYDVDGNSAAFIHVNIMTLDGGRAILDAPCYIVVSIVPESIGSDTTMLRQQTETNMNSFHQDFTFAQIVSRAGLVQCEVRSITHELIGKLVISLADLHHQKVVDRWFAVKHPSSDDEVGYLHLAIRFHFSKVSRSVVYHCVARSDFSCRCCLWNPEFTPYSETSPKHSSYFVR